MPKEYLIETKPVDLAKILQEYHDFLKKLNEQEKEPTKEKKKTAQRSVHLLYKVCGGTERGWRFQTHESL